jgi:thiosulfate reductase cytochrome b subunit
MRAAVLDHLRFKRPVETDSYNFLQRLSYLAVVFLFFPLIIITGLAMSPAITSVVPQMVTVFGGYETARTLHFFLADFLVLFLLVHVAMVILGGFKTRMLAMITGRPAASRKQAL